MNIQRMCTVITCLFLFHSISTNAKELSDVESCILESFHTFPEELTIREAKAQCREKAVTSHKTNNDVIIRKSQGLLKNV